MRHWRRRAESNGASWIPGRSSNAILRCSPGSPGTARARSHCTRNSARGSFWLPSSQRLKSKRELLCGIIVENAPGVSVPARHPRSWPLTGSMRGSAFPTGPSSMRGRCRTGSARSSATGFSAATIVWMPAHGTASLRPRTRLRLPSARLPDGRCGIILRSTRADSGNSSRAPPSAGRGGRGFFETSARRLETWGPRMICQPWNDVAATPIPSSRNMPHGRWKGCRAAESPGSGTTSQRRQGAPALLGVPGGRGRPPPLSASCPP